MKKLSLLLPLIFLAGCTNGFNAVTTFTPNETDKTVTKFNYAMDISNSTSEFTHIASVAPRILNSKILQATGIVSSGSTAYVVYNTRGPEVRGGLDILSIATVNSPSLVSSVVSQSAEYAEVKVKDSHIFMVGQREDAEGRHFALVTAMNVSNPAAPTVASEIVITDGWYATSIDIEGNTAFVTVPNLGVKEIDISNPAAMVVTATKANVLGNSLFTRRSQGKSVVLGGSANHQVSIIDSTHSVDAFMISTIPQEAPSRMHINGNTLYSNSAGKLTILDLTADIYQPQLKSHIALQGRGNGLTEHSCMAYLAQGEEGLQVFDVANKELPVLLGQFDYADAQDDAGSANNTYLMEVGSQKYIFVADGIGGIKIVSVNTEVSGCTENAPPTTPGLACLVYDLSATQPSVIPNFSAMTPVGSFITQQLDVPVTDSSNSFPYFPASLQHLKTWYGIVCEGNWTTTIPGMSTVYLSSDDGSRLYVNGNLALDNDGLHGSNTVSVSAMGVVGETNHLRIEYFQGPASHIQLELRIDGAYPAQYIHGFSH